MPGKDNRTIYAVKWFEIKQLSISDIGKAPKTPDSELTPTQLEQRNRRRRRNREAAARQRDRRAQIQKTLENELKNLREINRLKDEELIKLKVENENLREQMKSMYEASQIDIKK